ncbi:MAG: signal recognition particle protein [Verrucomicrobia bacterium]|nr:signal recognition particle protein [Verrucomicrobiota bacterium]
MFGALSERLQGVFSKLAGKKTLSEENIADAVREVRVALLEADVHYGVTKALIQRVKEQSLGQEVTKSVSSTEQFIKIIHDELVSLMGGGEAELKLTGSPAIVMVCGLQGSGKTTFCGKLAKFLRRPCGLVACDLQRPAAIEQLKVLGQQISTPVFSVDGEKNPLKVAKQGLSWAKAQGLEVLIVDTAGRLHVDAPLMEELGELKKLLSPSEILFVANATTGQDALTSAKAIDEKVAITGSVLTMLDGDTRGGAAISIREVTGKPLKFEGVGERLEDLRLFNPQSMADRILGMGDIVQLVKEAQAHVTEEEAEQMKKKLLKASFTYEDYLKQMRMVKKMGSMKKILKMLPMMKGLDMGALEGSDEQLRRTESVILSMTLKERREEEELIMPRRKRIARGSGQSLDEVNRLVKSFRQAKQFMKNAPKMKQLIGGQGWR